ncbi:hypothetical protein [Actinomadura sp. NPDC048394]|uniref:MmyB family transcriptional regulator n=1 Tax=Actinomadura sp. NPDC048394 TaxID=3158223 RepID=UPI003406CA7B
MFLMLETFDHVPAFILGRRTDVLASNHLARAVLTDFEALPARHRNRPELGDHHRRRPLPTGWSGPLPGQERGRDLGRLLGAPGAGNRSHQAFGALGFGAGVGRRDLCQRQAAVPFAGDRIGDPFGPFGVDERPSGRDLGQWPTPLPASERPRQPLGLVQQPHCALAVGLGAPGGDPGQGDPVSWSADDTTSQPLGPLGDDRGPQHGDPHQQRPLLLAFDLVTGHRLGLLQQPLGPVRARVGHVQQRLRLRPRQIDIARQSFSVFGVEHRHHPGDGRQRGPLPVGSIEG